MLDKLCQQRLRVPSEVKQVAADEQEHEHRENIRHTYLWRLWHHLHIARVMKQRVCYEVSQPKHSTELFQYRQPA